MAARTKAGGSGRAGSIVVRGLLVAALATAPACLRAQLPCARLDAVFPAGATPGSTTDVTIHGADLDDVEAVVFSHPGITAVPKKADPGPFDDGPRTLPDTFVVTIAPNVPPGHHTVRCRGRYGLSNGRVFVVDPVPHTVEAEPNDTASQATELTVPGVVDGRFTGGGDIDCFRLAGSRGQRLSIEVLARRIDSRADPVIRLLDPEGRLVDEARPGATADPCLEVQLSEDGEHLLVVADAVHGNGPDHGYEIRVTAAPRLAFVFPPAVAPGTAVDGVAYGWNLPGGTPSDLAVDARRLDRLPVKLSVPAGLGGQGVPVERLEPAQFALDAIEYRVPSPMGSSNAVLLVAADGAVVTDAAGNDTPATAQALALPAEVVGQFHPRRDVDWYRFEAKAGDVLWIELWSHRLGLPTDASLLIEQVTKGEDGTEQVKVVASVDDDSPRLGGREFDQRTFDPAYRFTAPADGTYRLLVRDGYSSQHDDPRLVYRLVVRPPKPDFRLVAVPVDTSGAILLRKGGRAALRVVAARLDGFDGAITVTAEGLPAGVTATEVVIGQAVSATEIVLTADAAAAAVSGTFGLVGRAAGPAGELVRRARFGAALDALPFAQPNQQATGGRGRIVDGVPVTVSADETAPVTLSLGGAAVVETSRGGVVKVPYTVARRDGAAAAITAFPVGLPPNVNLQQVAIGGGNGGEFEIRIPANAPTGSYSLCLAGAQQGLTYARNPTSATRAKERADAFAAVVTDAQGKAQAAKQAAQEATTKLNAANGAADEAAKSAARDAKAAADAADQQAQKRLADAQAEKRRLDQVAEQARQQSNPKPVNVVHPSNTLTLRIAEHPLKLGGIPGTVAGTQGMPLSIPFTVERLYGFTGEVTGKSGTPPGTTGIPQGNGRLAADQTTGMIAVPLAANATTGEHELPLTFSLNFNGQALTVTATVRATVAAALPAPK